MEDRKKKRILTFLEANDLVDTDKKKDILSNYQLNSERTKTVFVLPQLVFDNLCAICEENEVSMISDISKHNTLLEDYENVYMIVQTSTDGDALSHVHLASHIIDAGDVQDFVRLAFNAIDLKNGLQFIGASFTTEGDNVSTVTDYSIALNIE